MIRQGSGLAERSFFIEAPFLALLCATLAGCSTIASRGHPDAVAGTRIHFITLSQLEKSLPRAPIVAVFDIDDTTLFTSGGFQWGAKAFGSNVVSAGVPVREQDLKTEEEKRKFREFWTKMNNELDEYSVPKWIARELIHLHKQRGDKIY